MGLSAPIRDYLDMLVHPSVQHDAFASAKHRAFLAQRLLAGIVTLAGLPPYIAVRDVPSAPEFMVFAWLILPMASAYYLSRTGRYETAHIMSTMSVIGLGTLIALATGEIGSLVLVWFAIAPIEAAVSGSRRVLQFSSALVVAALLLLLGILGSSTVWPPAGSSTADAGVITFLSIVVGGLYAAGIALGVLSLSEWSEKLLEAERHHYRLLAHHTSEVIIRYDRNGAVLYASPRVETLLGAKARALTGHALFDQVHVADRPAYLKSISDAALSGEAPAVELRIQRNLAANESWVTKSPEFIWVEMRCRRADASPGCVHAKADEVVAVLTDIGERKKQEQALDRANTQIDRENSTKKQFLTNMSHELRTPLNAIIGFSDMLVRSDQSKLDETSREYANLISESGHNLLEAVNGIIELSKLESDDFELRSETFSPTRMMAACYQFLAQKALQRNVELSFHLTDELPEIVADPEAFKRIVINLGSYAIRTVQRGAGIAIEASIDSEHLSIVVAESPAADNEHIFMNCAVASASVRESDGLHEPTGFELSIVRRLTQLHGGDFKFSNRRGGRVRLIVRLPRNCEVIRLFEVNRRARAFQRPGRINSILNKKIA